MASDLPPVPPEWLPPRTAPRTGEWFLALLANPYRRWISIVSCPAEATRAGQAKRTAELSRNIFMGDRTPQQLAEQARRTNSWWHVESRIHTSVAVEDTHGILEHEATRIVGWTPLPRTGELHD